MTRRYFWLIPEFTKFRTIFEDAETVVGVSDDNEHRLFRKDTGKVCFDERDALRLSIILLVEAESEQFFTENYKAVCV